MPYITSKNNGDQFIEVCYQGKVTAAEMVNALGNRACLAREHHIQDHLVDLSQVVELPDLSDLYEVAAKIRAIVDTPLRKVAMVLPQSETIACDLLFYVMKARLNGVEIEMFNHRSEAVRWLTGYR